MYDLLNEPLLPVRVDGEARERCVSLPELYAAFVADRVDDLPELTAVQRQGLFHFLAQVGALALAVGERCDPPEDSDDWRGLLAALTPGDPAGAWSLVVDDPARPALLQPPITPEAFATYRPVGTTPDEIDVLVTAKNHDVKLARAGHARPHHWLYALIDVQTLSGYSGRGNPGIARMNGGFASRVLVDLAPSLRWGPRIVRAIRVSLDGRAEIARGFGYSPAPRGLGLLWLSPWDDDTSITLDRLDPCFVEVARRLRLVAHGKGTIEARFRPSNQPRVDARLNNGNLGDPWTPIALRDKTAVALTVAGAGFDYRLLQRVLAGEDIRPPAALQVRGDDPPLQYLWCAVLVRGQGRTEGFHERILPVTRKAAVMFADADARPILARAATRMVNEAGEVRRILRRAVLLHIQGAPDEADFTDGAAAPWLARFEESVDTAFFDHLWPIAEAGTDEARDAALDAWPERLRPIARRVLREVVARVAPPLTRREKAAVVAEAHLERGLYQQFGPGGGTAAQGDDMPVDDGPADEREAENA